MLRVVANPFVHLDHEGRPAAAVGYDPVHHSPDRRHVAAKHSAELVEARHPVDLVNVTGDARLPVHDIWFSFDADVQSIPDTDHYRRAMRPGLQGPALIPADESTAKAIGLPFVDPSHVIVETAKVALATYTADHGELPDWAHLHPGLLPVGQTATMKADEIHASHVEHAEFLAKHVARRAPATPPPAPPAARAPTFTPPARSAASEVA
jgi:hypothetical protein